MDFNQNSNDKNFLTHDALYTENEQEKKVPEKLLLAELGSYPIFKENIFYTICVILFSFFLANNFIGFVFSFFISIIYAIMHICKILNIECTCFTTVRLFSLFIYIFILNVVALPLDIIIYGKLWEFFTDAFEQEKIAESVFMNFSNFICPLVSFVNVMLAYGLIITFALGEYRPFWTYKRYFIKIIRNNIILVCLFLCCYIFSFQIISLCYEFSIAVYLISIINFIITEYILIIIMLSWTNFLYDDLYPPMTCEESL